MNSLKAYVTDSVDPESLNIELSGVTKLLIRHGRINIWCMNASNNASRFFRENNDLGNQNMPVYSIPLGTIADLHLNQMQAPLQINGPASDGVKVITEPPAADSGTYTVKKLITDYMENGTVNPRAGRLIIEIAKDQKITDFRSFIEQNDKSSLKAYKGCGVAVIDSIKLLANHFAIDNSHI